MRGWLSINRTNLIAASVFLLLAVGFVLYFHYRIEHNVCGWTGGPHGGSPILCKKHHR